MQEQTQIMILNETDLIKENFFLMALPAILSDKVLSSLLKYKEWAA